MQDVRRVRFSRTVPPRDGYGKALTAIWVVDEVMLAVEQDYLVMKIHEFYEYEVTQYDPQTGEGHFFQYINTFLKLKAEANGSPSWVQGPEGEESYIQTFSLLSRRNPWLWVL